MIFSCTSIYSYNLYDIIDISYPLHFEEQEFDVQLYDAELNFSDAPNLYISGKCNIHLNWKDNPEKHEFYFHLRSLTVDSVLYNSTKIEFKKNNIPEGSDFYYSVKPPIGTLQNDNVITIFYQGLMTNEGGSAAWGGVHSLSKNLFAMGVGFNNDYVSAARHWLPCYDHPSDKAKFKAAYIVPREYLVASTGLLTKTENLGDLTKYTWEHQFDCATYMLTFAVSEFELIDLTNDQLPIHIYAQNAQIDRCEYAFAKLPEMVKIFENLFIEYPFDKVGYVITPIGAMEHQTLISLDWGTVYQSKLKSDSLNSRIIHELSHQWFGGLVTPYDFRDAWLNESFATFAEALFYEKFYGREYYLEYMNKFKNRYINNVAKSEGVLPLYDFPRESPSSNYPQTIYIKGAVVLGMLRDMIGYPVFDGAIKEYLNSNAFGNVNTLILKDILEKSSSLDLTTFFDDWVYSPSWPKFNVRVEYSSDKVILNFDNIDENSSDELFFDIEFEYTNGDTEFRTINLSQKEQSIDLDISNVQYIDQIRFNSGNTTIALAEFLDISYTSVVSPSLRTYNIVPNPANSFVKISSSTDFIGKLEIFDIYGYNVFSGSISSNTFEFNTSNLSNGIYFIKFDDKNKTNIKKLIITH